MSNVSIESVTEEIAEKDIERLESVARQFYIWGYKRSKINSLINEIKTAEQSFADFKAGLEYSGGRFGEIKIEGAKI